MEKVKLETKDHRYIEVTPTWTGVLHIYVAALENPDATSETLGLARMELARMARLADKYVALLAVKKEGE